MLKFVLLLILSVLHAHAEATTELWSKCASGLCVYLYEKGECIVEFKAELASLPTPIVDKDIDLEVTHSGCQTWNNCEYCASLEDFNITSDGYAHPCIFLTQCGGSKTQLGCVTKRNTLADCLVQSCPNGCNSHGTCKSDGTCQCDSGWFGDDCSQQAPIFSQCTDVPNYGEFCLTIETDDCAIDTTITYLGIPIYQKTTSAPELNNTFRGDDSCFPVNIYPVDCVGCLSWGDYVLNETYAQACPHVNVTCQNTRLFDQQYPCFVDDALVPQCFGDCPLNCSGAGACVNGVCQCDNDHTGTACEFPSCRDLMNCYGNGECVAPHKCKCDAGYTTDNCGLAECSAVSDCSGHGSCIKPNVCKCAAGYTGASCTEIACPYNCQNGGECVKGACKCANGWEGADCSTQRATGTTGGDNKPSGAGHIVVGVLIGLLIAAGIAGGAFFVWRWRKSKRSDRGFSALNFSDDQDEQ